MHLDALDAAGLPPARTAGGDEEPYVGLDDVHLARWRGHALARIGDPEAVQVLTGVLHGHDAEFTRSVWMPVARAKTCVLCTSTGATGSAQRK